jgi:Uma2 family endonuclease
MALADARTQTPETGPIILTLTERVTEDTLTVLARSNPEYRFETTSDGKLVVSLLTGTFASAGEAELVRQLGNWNAEHRLGIVTSSSGGITLADGAIKGPDATFMSAQRIAALPPTRTKRAFAEIAPDAVFELLSPSDGLAYTAAKCDEYVATGSGVAVLLNPRDRSVTLYRKNHAPLVVRDAQLVTIGGELPGFRLDASAVFAACEPPSA